MFPHDSNISLASVCLFVCMQAKTWSGGGGSGSGPGGPGSPLVPGRALGKLCYSFPVCFIF